MLRNKSSGKKKWVDPDDAPELTKEFFRSADIYDGNKLVRRGRPRAAAPKRAISIRLSPEILEHFRSAGPGWQSRINEALKAYIATRPAKTSKRK